MTCSKSSQPTSKTLSLILLASLLSPVAIAEDDAKDTLTVLPVSRSLGTFGVEYEHGWNNTSWFLSAEVVNPFNGRPLDGGLDVGIRFFPFAIAPRWFFIGPHVGGSYYNAARETAVTPPAGNVRTIGVRVGVTGGVTVLLGENFVVSASAGGEYFREYFFATSTNELPTARADLRIIYRGAIGLAF